MNVLIIPEDFRKDQYIVKPLIERLLADLGRGAVYVRVCQDPLLGGVNEALKESRIREIIDRYSGMVQIFILCVDRDGNTKRKCRLEQLEQTFGRQCHFMAENAWEELETWVLAGLILPAGWTWREVRGDVSVKENYFEPLVKLRGLADAPGGGRKELAREASRRIANIRNKCSDDFGNLALRLERLIR